MVPFHGKLKVRHLEIVLTIADCGSLSRAAQELGMTQSALSRATVEIEELIGGRLFERTGRGMVATPLGATLCRHAQVLIGDLARAEADLAAVSKGDLGSLSVGCFSMFSGWPLAQAAQRFHERHPRVSLSLHIGLTERLIEDLDSGRLDILISRHRPGLGSGIYGAAPLLHDAIVLACALSHPLARTRAPTLADCIAWPWVAGPAKNRLREEVELMLRQQGLALPEMVGALSVEFSLEMLASGRYLCMLPGSVASVLQAQGKLRVLPVPLDLRRWPLAAIWRRDRPRTHAQRGFVAALKAVISREGASGA